MIGRFTKQILEIVPATHLADTRLHLLRKRTENQQFMMTIYSFRIFSNGHISLILCKLSLKEVKAITLKPYSCNVFTFLKNNSHLISFIACLCGCVFLFSRIVLMTHSLGHLLPYFLSEKRVKSNEVNTGTRRDVWSKFSAACLS